MNRLLPQESTAALLRTIQNFAFRTEYEPEKHRLILYDEAGNEQLYFRLPITFTYPANCSAIDQENINYVILLIQSGNCAIGYFENGVNLDHKVFRSYMVRKKQGKSQIKYLKTKGKSRAGSRVRLGETVEFFENINERLQSYFGEHKINRIAISCSKTLIPYLYNSKVATPFTKNDPRLFKIPKHIHTPIYEVLLDANRFLLRGELIYDEKQQELAESLLAVAEITASEIDNQEDLTDEGYDSWE
ncbi:hypothetical protein ABID22_003884 [Pontibacter aydingkolensis]|uniref:VLRF1 domain-containing protein n=1 Tax=Pontibacter aydingkolensis TaxID=1911536 RepID=A0ABS7CZD6_9BACT|nr:hypothetical protein [Pontibacter aydingkolensis]MBW7469168.1 hypothetical protein [Pontibacter aydingkolensis]